MLLESSRLLGILVVLTTESLGSWPSSWVFLYWFFLMKLNIVETNQPHLLSP